MTDNVLELPYSRRDVQEILAEIKVRAKALSEGRWTDFNDADIGYALIKCMVGLFDFNAFYVDRMAQEGFLSTARYREGVVRNAKMIGYHPYPLQSAYVEALISFPAFGGTVSIPAHSLWKVNGITFVCQDPIEIPPGQTSLQITLKQGTRYVANYTAPGTSWFFVNVPKNIAELSVSVEGEEWEPIDFWIDVINPKSYKVSEEADYRVVRFGGDIGTNRPANGDEISVTGIISKGKFGNIPVSGAIVSPVSYITDGVNDVTNSFRGYTLTAALGGTDNESTASIRANAPAFYGTQGRVVSAKDYEAVIKQIPGVEEVLVIGGQEIKRYGEVLIIVHGEDPYTVSPDLLNLVKVTLERIKVVTVQLDVRAPIVVEEQLTVDVGLKREYFPTQSEGFNAVNTMINEFYTDLKIAENRYGSALESAVMSKSSGFEYINTSSAITTFANSQAGVIQIPLIENYDLSEAVLKKANGDIIWEGDANPVIVDDVIVSSEFVGLGKFKYSVAGLPDQKVTLTYKSDGGKDVLVSTYQLVLLKSISINTVHVD